MQQGDCRQAKLPVGKVAATGKSLHAYSLRSRLYVTLQPSFMPLCSPCRCLSPLSTGGTTNWIMLTRG